MAEYKHQVQDFRAGHQHLANRQQEASASPAVLIHQHQHRAALVTAQDSERQHLQHQVGGQLLQPVGLVQHQA